MLTAMRMAMLVNLLFWLSACAVAAKPDVSKPISSGTRFSVSVPGAKSVSLVGSFNGWSPTAHPMAPAGPNGLWTVVVPLPKGEYAFIYLIDGARWMKPPRAQDYVTDGFGNTNGIAVVR